MIKCPFHVEQRLFLKLLTPSLPLLPQLRVNRSKKGGATLYSSFEAFCNWTHLIDIPQAHNYNATESEGNSHFYFTFLSFFLKRMNTWWKMCRGQRRIKVYDAFYRKNGKYWLIISARIIMFDNRSPWGWNGPLWVSLSGSSYSLISPPPLTRSYHFPLWWRGNSAQIRLCHLQYVSFDTLQMTR